MTSSCLLLLPMPGINIHTGDYCKLWTLCLWCHFQPEGSDAPFSLQNLNSLAAAGDRPPWVMPGGWSWALCYVDRTYSWEMCVMGLWLASPAEFQNSQLHNANQGQSANTEVKSLTLQKLTLVLSSALQGPLSITEFNSRNNGQPIRALSTIYT